MASSRCRVSASFAEPLSVWKTIWSASPDCCLNDFCSSSSARVDSVPGSEKESEYWSPAAWLRPPRTKRPAIQSASTGKRWVKHQRARGAMGAAEGNVQPMENLRQVEEGVTRDLRGKQTYAGYLDLERLLAAQRPISQPQHHDELLFIVQHQTSELWMKLIIHELDAVLRFLAEDDLGPAQKGLARVKQIQRQLFEQWGVLATLTPSEYVKFRGVLGDASGFQSLQYRIIEFQLGNKNREMLEVFSYSDAAYSRLRAVLEAPSLYDEFLRHLARRGYPIPPDCVERDFTEPHRRREDLLPVLKAIYDAPERDWEAYEMCEELIDVEESFQLWRFRHMKTVERIIGHKRGTGGSTGVGFLRASLDLTFFPELLDVRTEIGR